MQQIDPEVPEEFKALLRRVGADFALTQGLGGNSSYKLDGEMLIKASGKRLMDVDDPNYFYRVGISDSDYVMLPIQQNGKPSIEVFLHALIGQTFVLHLHSALGVALSMLAAVSPDLQKQLSRNGVCLLPYSRPGEPLRQAINEALSHREYSAFLLQNHGVLYFADSVVELEHSISKFEGLWANLLYPLGKTQLAPSDRNEHLSKDQSHRLLWHARENWRVSPDHCVFLGVNSSEWINSLERTSVKDILVAEESQGRLSVIQEQLLWFINVAINLPEVVLPTLSLEEANSLRGWESEIHRIKEATAGKGVVSP